MHPERSWQNKTVAEPTRRRSLNAALSPRPYPPLTSFSLFHYFLCSHTLTQIKFAPLPPRLLSFLCLFSLSLIKARIVFTLYDYGMVAYDYIWCLYCFVCQFVCWLVCLLVCLFLLLTMCLGSRAFSLSSNFVLFSIQREI